MPFHLLSPQQLDSAVSQWRLADPSFESLVQRQEPLFAILRYLGLTAWKESRIDEAVALLTAAASVHDGIAIRNDLGGALQAAGRPHEAAQCIEASLALDHNQPRSWLSLATIRAGLDDLEAAEKAYRRALAIAPTLAEAFLGLGILSFRQRRFADCVTFLRAAIDHGGDTPTAQACLGQAHFMLGDFNGAADALALAVPGLPEALGVRQKLTQAHLMRQLIEGDAQEAVDVYRGAVGLAGDDVAVATQKAFHLLSAFGHRDAAIRLGRWRLAQNSDDPMQRYLLAAVSGDALERAPDDYLQAYFDRFAADFEKQLVDNLDYHVPEKLQALVTASAAHFERMLDLGCGTGLAAPLLAPLGGSLTGVDISPRMLQQAAERALYTDLVESEVLLFLARRNAPFDLIFAADLLVYIGDLKALMAGVALCLKPGGLFAFSIETTHDADFVLLLSGRFAHDPDYVSRLTATDFESSASCTTMIRLEANVPVNGILFVLRRR